MDYRQAIISILEKLDDEKIKILYFFLAEIMG